MGFRQGAYARIWSVNDQGKYSIANVTVSKKNKETGKYEIEFAEKYVRLVGKAHEAAKRLALPTAEEFDGSVHKGISIQISSCDVSRRYIAEKQQVYTNFVVFEFEIPDDNYGKSASTANKPSATKNKSAKDYAAIDDEPLPF